MKLHRGTVDGKVVWFVRTDASDRYLPSAEKLVFVPKLAPLAGDGLSGAVYCEPLPAHRVRGSSSTARR